MPRHNEAEAYIKVIDQAVDDALISTARARTIKGRALGADANVSREAKNAFRAMLWKYYEEQPRPVRVTTGAALVLTGHTQDWLEDHRQFLGYDRSKRPLLYEFDEIEKYLNERVHRAVQGRRIIVLVDGREVVGTFAGIFAFKTMSDLLDAGATIKVVTVEELIRLRWRNREEHARWVRAYMRALPLLIPSE